MHYFTQGQQLYAFCKTKQGNVAPRCHNSWNAVSTLGGALAVDRHRYIQGCCHCTPSLSLHTQSLLLHTKSETRDTLEATHLKALKCMFIRT